MEEEIVGGEKDRGRAGKRIDRRKKGSEKTGE